MTHSLTHKCPFTKQLVKNIVISCLKFYILFNLGNKVSNLHWVKSPRAITGASETCLLNFICLNKTDNSNNRPNSYANVSLSSNPLPGVTETLYSVYLKRLSHLWTIYCYKFSNVLKYTFSTNKQLPYTKIINVSLHVHFIYIFNLYNENTADVYNKVSLKLC